MKNILVTGVSKGLGLDIARILIQHDIHVWGISRRENAAIRELSTTYPDRFTWKSVDLDASDRVKADLFDDFITLDIPLHGVVNNAAVAYDDIVTNMQLSPLEKMYRVNVFSPMIITKYAIRNMLLHNIAGSIIHISSISVHTGYKGLAMYASTKGALEAFSKNTAREWGSRSIRSNTLVAGFMETSMSATLRADQKERIYKRTALKRATDPQSVAETILFLLSDAAHSITGQNIHVDSGTI